MRNEVIHARGSAIGGGSDPAMIAAMAFAAVFLLSKLPGLALGYGLDDYSTTAIESDGLWRGFIAQGRFSFAALHALLSHTNLHQPDFATIGFGALVFSFAWFCFLVVREMRLSSRPFALALGAFLGSDPFFAEYVSFRQSMLPMAACIGLTVFAIHIYLRWRDTGVNRLAVVTTISVAAAAGLNQLSVALFCIGVFACELARPTSEGSMFAFGRAFWRTVLAGAVATLSYTVIAIGAISIFGVADTSDARVGFVSIEGWVTRLSQVFQLLTMIGGGQHTMHGGLAIGSLWVSAFILALPKRPFGVRFRSIATATAFFIISTLIAVFPAAVAASWWPVPRVLIIMPIAAMLGLGLLASGADRWQMRISAGLVLLTAFLFAGKSSSILIDQQRLNRWDMHLAQSILSAVDARFGPAEHFRIVLHSPRWAHAVAPDMPNGDLNVSAVSVGWSADAVFEEASGRRVDVSVDPHHFELCQENGSRFPAADAMFEIDGAVHVCL